MTMNNKSEFLPLELVTAVTVNTDQAAYHLNRKSQTLRAWACLENGPIKPLRIHSRLAWRVSDLKTLLGVAL
jgi:hypothetical protein